MCLDSRHGSFMNLRHMVPTAHPDGEDLFADAGTSRSHLKIAREGSRVKVSGLGSGDRCFPFTLKWRTQSTALNDG
jgi:hypothetical protein